MSSVTQPINSHCHEKSSHVPTQANTSTDEQVGSTVHAETLIQQALDCLEEKGAPQKSNQMNLDEILNPIIESDHNIFDATDEDIYNAVMDVKETKDSPADETDGMTEVEAPTTRKEALQGALAVLSYLGTWDDPFACEVEAVLGLFRRKTRALEMQGMRNDKIMNYFERK